MYVCTCRGITDGQIKEKAWSKPVTIHTRPASRAYREIAIEISAENRDGLPGEDYKCGQCKCMGTDIVEDVRREMHGSLLPDSGLMPYPKTS